MSASRTFPWKTTVVAVTILLLALIAAAVFLLTVHETRESMNDLVGKFATGKITTTFIEDIPTITSTHGNVLELATSKSVETFKREDARNSFWDSVYIGTTTAEIRAPVTFRYHLLLSDPWRLVAKGNVCVVYAPQFQPSLPPAIDTTSMEKHAESGWARFDSQAQLDQLEKDMTDMLDHRARDRAHQDIVREQCRGSVADFVKAWLIQRAQWTNTFDAIVVVFPDELSVTNDAALLNYDAKPTIQIQR